MKDITRIGMDTSKSVFQLHGVAGGEQPVLRRTLRRRQVLDFFRKLPATEVGLEACGGAHYWARELAALGHEVKLLPAQHVKPYVRRNKNDAADAEAICEAMSQPRLQERFVPVKSAEQQAGLMLMGVRDQLIGRRTQLSNAIRGHAAEFGVVAAKGLDKIEPLLARIAGDELVPELARELFAGLGEDYARLAARLKQIEARLMAWHRGNEMSRRLAEILSIGPICATGLVMKVPNPQGFRSGRNFAACGAAGSTGVGIAICAGISGALTVLSGGSIADALQAMAFTVASANIWSAIGTHITAPLQEVMGVAEGVMDSARVAFAAVKSVVHGVIGGALSMVQGGEPSLTASLPMLPELRPALCQREYLDQQVRGSPGTYGENCDSSDRWRNCISIDGRQVCKC